MRRSSRLLDLFRLWKKLVGPTLSESMSKDLDVLTSNSISCQEKMDPTSVRSDTDALFRGEFVSRVCLDRAVSGGNLGNRSIG